MHPQSSANLSKISSTKMVLVTLLLLFVAGFWILFYLTRPIEIEEKTYFKIQEGDTLIDVLESLHEKELVRSPSIFYAYSRLVSKGDDVVAGLYEFGRPTRMKTFLHRFEIGEFGDTVVRFQVIGGRQLKTIGYLAEKDFFDITQEDFLSATEGMEGELFPDTYTFFKDATLEDLINTLNEKHLEVFDDLYKTYKGKQSKEDILIMASIIEREAYGVRDAATISGILWKRIDEGMLLQVDATFAYTLGKASSQITMTELRDPSNLYNTYVHKGLPPTAIGAPGRVSLEAAMNPKDSPYYFYLHAPGGQIHYGKTFDDHKSNRRFLK